MKKPDVSGVAVSEVVHRSLIFTLIIYKWLYMTVLLPELQPSADVNGHKT